MESKKHLRSIFPLISSLIPVDTLLQQVFAQVLANGREMNRKWKQRTPSVFLRDPPFISFCTDYADNGI